ncbi:MULTISPECIES: MMPL family transporter [unclassified Mycolicibacterium]|uniref:MMPL family transporter n=1 Tax=unclassified Mycolicibacterium TaxID=2636767 RepID=UPI002EDA067F
MRWVAALAMVAPRRVIAVALLVMAGCAVFGIPVVKHLSGGGFRDPTAESSRASTILADQFNQPDMQLLVTLTFPQGITTDRARAVGVDVVKQLQQSPYVAHVQSPWSTPPQTAAQLTSVDGKTGLIVAGLAGGETHAPTYAKDLIEQVGRDRDGVLVRAGGSAMVNAQINEQTEKDLLLMESLAIPLSFLVLVWVFGGLIAAVLPLAVGAMAIFGAMAVLRAMTFVTDVSIFALNLAVAMGLALAIDYTLLLLSRYRDELADGHTRDDALLRTMSAAGRTVLFSAMIVGLSMLPMALFPMYFLKSFAYAGVAVVAFAACAALVVTPAAIALLGARLDSLDVRRLVRRILRRPDPVHLPVEQMFWYRSTKAIIRRAVPVGLVVTAVLLALGAPFLGVRWGFPDDRVLPTSTTARQVGDQLRTEFATDSANDITVVVPDVTGVSAAELTRYATALSSVADVSWVSAPVGMFKGGRQAGPGNPETTAGGAAYLTVASTTPLFSDASNTQLDRLHAVPGPGDRSVLLTGTAQINRDIVAAVTSGLPKVLVLIAVTSFVLLFLLTGSVVLPLKTLVLNVLSLTAAFGALVWIFQDGHLGALGTTATGTLAANMPVLLFCITFGLSMDYEVFLISRIREYWLASGHPDEGQALESARVRTDEAVAKGLAHTGRVITAAAVIMSISFAALMAAQVSFMRMFGVGLTIAVLMDATLVRLILVPAFMHVMGGVNWWAPGPLVRLHKRIGISEEGGGRSTTGRHRAPDSDRPAEPVQA